MVKNLPQCRRPRFDSGGGKIPYRKEWLPTPVFLTGGFHRQRSLVGYSPWGPKEPDTIFHIRQFFILHCLEHKMTGATEALLYEVNNVLKDTLESKSMEIKAFLILWKYSNSSLYHLLWNSWPCLLPWNSNTSIHPLFLPLCTTINTSGWWLFFLP